MKHIAIAQFPLGHIVATPGALASLEKNQQSANLFLTRHAMGDWGELDKEDVQTNNDALKYGNRLLSAYHTKDGEKLWIITEADRSVTTLLLPDEY
jgi:hypothetical protein